MSRDSREQNTIEDLKERLEAAIDSYASGADPKAGQEILRLIGELRKYGIEVGELSYRAPAGESTKHPDADRRFCPHRDGLLTIVCDPVTGRRGSVVDIFESAPECIEYTVSWFDTRETSKSPYVFTVKKDAQ